MKRMDYSSLQVLSENRNPSNHSMLANSNKICMESIDILNENFKEFLKDRSLYECSSLLISENNWMRRRKNDKCTDFKGREYPVEERQIIQVDYGKTYSVECGIIHYCVVLKVLDKKIFTIPMTTNSDEIKKAYHPIHNPNGKFDYRQGYLDEGYTENVALYINDIKCISKGRILPYKSIDKINVDAYNELKEQILKLHFKEQFYSKVDRIRDLETELKKITSERDSLLTEVNLLKDKE